MATASIATLVTEGTGATFRAAREGAGVTLRELAREAGISHPTISRWERGERDISPTTYAHLSRTLADLMAHPERVAS